MVVFMRKCIAAHLAALALCLLSVPGHKVAAAQFQSATATRVQKNLVTDYGAKCDGTTDDTRAFLAFRAAFQGSTPVQLNLPGFCTFNPGGGEYLYPFKGIADLIVAGNGTTTSSIKNINSKGNFLLGGRGQFQDSSHSLRSNTANAGDSCVTIKTAPSVTVTGIARNLSPTAVFTASSSGTTMTVRALSSGTIVPGAHIANQDSNVGRFAAIQPYGTGGTTGTGGTGTYALTVASTFSSQKVSTTPASFTASVDAGGMMTVSSVADGTLTAGMFVYDSSGGVDFPTTIKSQLTGTAGGVGTYQLSAPPRSAQSSQDMLGNGQIRVALNSTTGLTSGDTLYLAGVTGRGQIPQRVNGLQWIKVVDSTHIDLFQRDFNGSYTSGGTGGGDRTSLVPAGSKVMMSGWANQAYWADPYGFPSNQHWFEYKTVASTNSSTHQVCFDTPLANTYKSTWPQFNTGSQFEIDAAGPATLYALDSSWELTHVYQDLTLDNPNFQTTANGRNVTYSNVKMTGGNCAIPSQNETHTWINVDASTCNIELDKLVQTWNVSNTTVHQAHVQSSSMDLISLDTVTADKWYGTPKKFVASNFTVKCNGCTSSDFAFGIGTLAYGATDEVTCTNCTVSNGVFAHSIPFHPVNNVNYPWSMSGGIIIIPNPYNAGSFDLQTRGLVPGHNVLWQGEQLVGRVFQVTDATQDLDNIYVQTSEPGGFPTGAWTPGNLLVFPHPAPKLTMVNITGSNSAIAFNGCPAQSPMYSCQNFTYTGGASGGITAGFRPTLWGALNSFSFTNNVPYTNTGALTWQISQFNNWPVLKTDLTTVTYGASPHGQAIVDTKLPSSCSPLSACTRTLTASGATNSQAGDTISVPPSGALFGGPAFSGPIFSANTPLDSPQVTISLTTTQNVR
jgi:hypothetical protein